MVVAIAAVVVGLGALTLWLRPVVQRQGLRSRGGQRDHHPVALPQPGRRAVGQGQRAGRDRRLVAAHRQRRPPRRRVGRLGVRRRGRLLLHRVPRRAARRRPADQRDLRQPHERAELHRLRVPPPRVPQRPLHQRLPGGHRVRARQRGVRCHPPPPFPAAPGGAGSTAADGGVSVTWPAVGPPPGDPGGTVTGYTVSAYRSGTTTPVATTTVSCPKSGTCATTATLGGLANGITYYATVAAANAAGTGAPAYSASTCPPGGPPRR